MVKDGKLILVKGTAVMLLFLYSVNLFAQVNNDKQSLIFSNQLRFSFAPVLYDNLELYNTGELLLNSLPCFSGEATISYYHYFLKGFGLNIGAGLGLAPFNVNFNFKPPLNSIYQTGPYKEYYEYLDYSNYLYMQDLYVFPISLQKYISLKKREHWYYNIEAGVKLNIKVAYPYEIKIESWYGIDDTTEVQLFDFYLFETGKKNFFSYFLKVGLFKLTNKYNSFNYNFVFHYSPQKIGSGWYKFYELNYDSYGTVKQNINYIGFEFTYGLTLSKRPRNE
jgi:hypothetical protein